MEKKCNMSSSNAINSTRDYSLLFHGSLLWNTLPREIKEINSTELLKAKLEEIRNVSYTCPLCR